MVEPSTWTAFDKTAAALALTFAAGYAIGPIKLAVVTGVSGLVGPLAVWLPFSALVFGLGGVSGLTSAIARRRLRDADRVEQARERTERLREQLSAVTDDDSDPADADAIDTDDPSELQRRLQRATVAAMREEFRPVVWSMLVSIPAFLWIRWAVTAPAAAIAPAAVVVPTVGSVAWTATLIGPIKLWLVWYLAASLSTGAVARRLADRLPALG